jgi:hypothetical protein
MDEIERFKVASLKSFELAESLLFEIENSKDEEIRAGLRIVASQNYFYAGEFGIKYLLKIRLGNLSREKLKYYLRIHGKKHIDSSSVDKIYFAYDIILRPINQKGETYSTRSRYKGINGNNFLGMQTFAKTVIQAIKEE